MNTQMTFKVDSATKNQFSSIARSYGKNKSHILRELVESFILKENLENEFDKVWNAIGDNLKSNGIKTSDIDKIVQDVRLPKS